MLSSNTVRKKLWLASYGLITTCSILGCSNSRSCDVRAHTLTMRHDSELTATPVSTRTCNMPPVTTTMNVIPISQRVGYALNGYCWPR